MGYKDPKIRNAYCRKRYAEGWRPRDWRKEQCRLNTPWYQEYRRKAQVRARLKYLADPEAGKRRGRLNSRRRYAKVKAAQEQKVKEIAAAIAKRILLKAREVSMGYGYEGTVLGRKAA